jgi:hypothetical protein
MLAVILVVVSPLILEALLSPAVALGLPFVGWLSASPDHLVCLIILLCFSFALCVFVAVVGLG